MAQEFNAKVPEFICKMMEERGYQRKADIYLTDLLSWLYEKYNAFLDISVIHTDIDDKENVLCWTVDVLDVTTSSAGDGASESFAIDNETEAKGDVYYKENRGGVVFNYAVYTSYVDCVLGTAIRLMNLFDK